MVMNSCEIKFVLEYGNVSDQNDYGESILDEINLEQDANSMMQSLMKQAFMLI